MHHCITSSVGSNTYHQRYLYNTGIHPLPIGDADESWIQAKHMTSAVAGIAENNLILPVPASAQLAHERVDIRRHLHRPPTTDSPATAGAGRSTFTLSCLYNFKQ